VVGLMAFDVNNIDGSIQGLLTGLKTAFFTSLVGILLSILFKVIQSAGFGKGNDVEEASHATPEAILGAINQQRNSLDALVGAIGGESDGSILSQMKLLRGDLNDSHKLALKSQQETAETLNKITEQLATQKESFDVFTDKLWIKMQDFADMLSKSATETVIEALKQVITDFNNNLTEQFGENFKQLNEAVKELVVWQDNYKVQIADMTEQYKLGVESISATEQSVAKISTESKFIPESMTNLKEVMEVNQHQLAELERHLDAFKDIRDRAVEAVPEIRKQVDETVKTIADSVEAASTHYNVLLSESDKYIQTHIASSNDLLSSFVSNTREGIETIADKLDESVKLVQQSITQTSDEFRDNIDRANGGLQNSSSRLEEGTEAIRLQLKDTVEDLNETVRSLINGLVEDAKSMSSTLSDANKALVTDTSSARDSVTQSIEAMQKRLEASLEDATASQTQHMQRVFSNLDAGLKEQVGKTGEAVQEQLNLIDQSMQRELNSVMNTMGKNLGQIANQFVKDYSYLTEQMSIVVKKAS
ncbi:hypothetical protein DBR45_41490, partial [Pseudomonas sp. HMWF031]